MRAAPSSRPARIGARIGAAFVDTVLLYAIVIAIALALVSGGLDVGRPAGPLFIGMVFAVYEIVLTTVFGQTVGKRVAGTVVVDAADRCPSLGRSAVRYLAKNLIPVGLVVPVSLRLALGLYPFVVLLSIAVSGDRRGLHDRLSGTTVFEARARRSLLVRAPEQHGVTVRLAPTYEHSKFGRYRKRRVPKR